MTMKKEYLHPAIEVDLLLTDEQLLAGSVTTDSSTGDVESISGDGGEISEETKEAFTVLSRYFE